MQEAKKVDKKKKNRIYYNVQRRMNQAAKEAGHQLALAMSDEEDAVRWQTYKSIMEKWQKYERKHHLYDGFYSALHERTYYKPVFDETYINYTKQLKELYDAEKHAEGKAHREIKDKIREVRRQRRESANYIMRDTGEIAEDFTP